MKLSNHSAWVVLLASSSCFCNAATCCWACAREDSRPAFSLFLLETCNWLRIEAGSIARMPTTTPAIRAARRQQPRLQAALRRHDGCSFSAHRRLPRQALQPAVEQVVQRAPGGVRLLAAAREALVDGSVLNGHPRPGSVAALAARVDTTTLDGHAPGQPGGAPSATIDTARIVDPIVGFIFDNKGLMYNLTLEGSKISRIWR